MRKRYTIALALIVCAILLCVSILFQYRAYLEDQSYGEAITMVTEELSINYLNGNKIKVDEKTKEINFSVTNHSTETKYFYIRLLNISGNTENLSYGITANIEGFEPVTANFSQTILGSRIKIEPNETLRFVLTVQNPQERTVTFEIETDIEQIDNSFASTVLANNTILENTDASDGLIRKAEQDGDVYYFKGNVTNNYVSFAGQSWRIVKINEDGTVKLVLNGVTEQMIPMNTSENVGNTNFTQSNVNQQLESWYAQNLMDYDDLISSTRYCFDDSIMTDENNQIEYLSDIRIFTEQNPTNACNGTSVPQKIALLTADEVMYAGGSANENTGYYLYLDGLQGSYWTMTPHKKENNTVSYIVVNNDGSLKKDALETANLFVRPVITIIRRASVEGEGTIENPYTLTYGT